MVPNEVSGSATPLANVLAALERYALRCRNPEEAAALLEFAPFVRAYPDCLWRTCLPGHLTASAWIVDPARTRTLLTHHRKLDRWLQLGGHADGDADLAAAALREAREESGLTRLRLVTPEIFDVDRHRIPKRGPEPEHWHYDVRFLIEADPGERLVVTAESKDLVWIALDRVSELTTEESVLRMVRKTRGD